MKRHTFILALIIFGIVALGIFYHYRFLTYEGYRYFDISSVLMPIALLSIPGFAVTFFATWIFPKLRSYKMHILIGTNALGLLVGCGFIAKLYYNEFHRIAYEFNIERNHMYKNFYNDGRDTLIKLAIDQIERKQSKLNDYGIEVMNVMERDTMKNGSYIKYYEISQMYYLGDHFDKSNARVASHIVYADKFVQELYDQPLRADSIGKSQWSQYLDFTKEIKPYRDSLRRERKQKKSSN